MECFSTRGLPASRKVSFWNSISSELFASMEIAPRDPRNFDGLIRRESVGQLTLMDVRSSAVRIERHGGHLARRNTDSFLLLAPQNGPMQVELRGLAPVVVQAGEVRLIDNGRPYTIVHGDDLQTLCLDIPRELMGRIVNNPERLVGARPAAGPAVQRALVAVLRSLNAVGEPAEPQRLASALFADAIVGLVGSAFVGGSEGGGVRPNPGLLGRVLASIDARAHDAELRQLDIAAEFGVSTRYLRQVLNEGGQRFGQYLLRRRLDRAAQLLADRARRHASITDLALECGFNNTTHFGYAFKRRFGLTPTAYRTRRQS